MFGKNKNIDKQSELEIAGKELSRGSLEAFHFLYEKYQNNAYRFCLRMLGDESLAKDAFQETFIKVYEHRREFKGENFAAWLFTIARHTCLNMIRSQKEYDLFDEEFHSTQKAPYTDVGMKDYIEKAIAKLPVALREALILREYEDCSYNEIASILGIELSLAKVRVHRARLILRKLLKPLMKELHESR
jgi:RNA polymerase sigma-70 factor (ECF subfamily)